jgi:Cd2+/Zn2+-exporting ATPase
VKAAGCTDPANDRCTPCDEMLALASAVEQRSEHPLARAVVDASISRAVVGQFPVAADVQALAGQGVRGRVGEQTVIVGSHRYFDEYIPHGQEQCTAIEAALDEGHTPMLVGVDQDYLGFITVADTVRAGSRDTISRLEHLGVETIVMLTGDDPAAARSIAADVGLSNVRAGLLPEEKVTAVEELLGRYETVVMVGDGINDAPALARATVGIAMGAAGTAQALETADVALMGDDLALLPFLLRLSRTTMNTIRANVVLSLGIKLVFLILVLLGLGSMWLAVLADMGASLLVTLNGVRLLRRPRMEWNGASTHE